MSEINETEEPMVECADGEMRPEDECVCCADGEYRPIHECVEDCDGDWHHASETIELASGDIVHQEDSRIVLRADGEYDWEDDCVCIDGEYFHNGECCSCDHCGDYMLNGDACSGPGGDTLCQGCLDHHTGTCEDCCECEYSDNLCYHERRDVYLCESCFSDADSQVIRCYSDKTANRLSPESSDAILYGIELEVEAKGDREDAAESVLSLLGDTYCVLKDDGSLGPGGFEIVTRRDSVAVHKKKWTAFFDSDPSKSMSSWGTDRCGMHVHVSKAPLSQLQLGKMLCFLNDPFNTNMVTKIAGRKSERWSKIAKKKISDVNHSAERYVALNITSKTAEFRIFKGTLSRAGFFKNLEFCQALVEFTSPASRSIMDATSFRSFCSWLPYKSYPNLYDFLVRKRFILDDRRPKKKSA